jgi:GDP-4-dehydro-6-deoxy-D-mannose reductase
MRALITGINGFAGGHLAECLLASNEWDVWGIARQAVPALPHLRDQVRYIVADMTSVEDVAAALRRSRPDVVFHLAGQSNVPRSFDDPAGTLTTNTLSGLALFQAVIRLKQDPLLLIVGSNEIYGQVRPDDLPLTEEAPLRPVSPYAVSKATQDLLAFQYYVSHRLRTVRLRPFNHIGPRQSELFVASAFAAQIARIEVGIQPPLMKVGNLAAERDFTDVRDMVAAYACAAVYGQAGAAYNIGSDRSVSVCSLLDTLLCLSECDITVEPDPARMRPADVPRVVCDSRHFRADTGWAPRFPLERTLGDLLDYWRVLIRTDVC